jgi:hypothetical protein
MPLKSWHQVIDPRDDLKEGKPLDTSEFAVNLDHVRRGTAPDDYVDAERFFQRTYLTENLLDMAAQTVRRLNGITTETTPVFNLATQFGGGKTHSLTLLWHLAKLGTRALHYQDVDRITRRAGVSEIPTAIPAVFVGTEFSSVSGRGEPGEPVRRTPWGEMAFQLHGAEGFELVRAHDDAMVPPAGDDLNKLFRPDQPYLLLFDELLNYVSNHRHYHDMGAQLYNFMQTLTEFVRSRKNIVLAVCIPASELEMNPQDQADYERFKKMLDRLGKPMFMSAGRETTEIIRRRLFNWTGLPAEAKPIITQYVDWVREHRSQLPGTFNVDAAREQFEASYPFHPQVLSLFERKWQSLPRFQQTRGILRLLALWVARAYQDGYKGNAKEPLITLGTAPLDDSGFRAAVFEQLGENRLEAAVSTDIAGNKNSHARRLDDEAIDGVKKARLHRKCATTIFFESNGGMANGQATLPEIKFSLGEPDLDIGLVDGVMQSLLDSCYYLTAHGNKFKFSTQENLIKRFTDRRAGIAPTRVQELVEAEVRKVFEKGQGFERILFPEKSGHVPDRPVLTLVVMHPSRRLAYPETRALLDDLARHSSQTTRAYRSALIFAVADDDTPLREEARNILAWDDIDADAEELHFEPEQRRQIKANALRARKDLSEKVWNVYNTLFYLDKKSELLEDSLGRIHSSQAASLAGYYLTYLSSKSEISEEVSPGFLTRNWPPAFTEWSTRNVRDAFYASPLFPRLLKADALRATIALGVTGGQLAYVGPKNASGKYDPFYFDQPISASDVEISDDVFILTKEEAKRHIEPRQLTTLRIVPSQHSTEPSLTYTFLANGFDQHGDAFALPGPVTWSTTAGSIDAQGKLTVGEDEGTFTVTAQCVDLSATATVSVARRATTKAAEPTPTTTRPRKLAWSGTVQPSAWMQLYMKVLARHGANPKLKINVRFELDDEALSDQQREETRTALKELGLGDLE